MDMNEKISALMDEELERADGLKVLDALKNDEAAREQWRRYQLYGAVMREELPSTLAVDFHERVAAKLASEPVRLAPAAMKKGPSWQVPAIGLAVAASLLAVVVMIQKPFTRATDVAPVQLASAPVQQADRDMIRTNHNSENVRERINRLLVEHNEYNPATDMTGMMPYARFVSYTNGAPE